MTFASPTTACQQKFGMRGMLIKLSLPVFLLSNLWSSAIAEERDRTALSKRYAIAKAELVSNNTSSTGNSTESSTESSNVLVIHSYNPELSWTQQSKTGIDAGFEQSDHNITVYHEFLDAKRYPSLHHQTQFLDYVRFKYQDTPLKVLMVADDPGLILILETRDEYFPNLPIVFLGINTVQEKLLNIPWLTGVFETHGVFETIVEAKRQTGSDTLIMINDSTETGQARVEGITPVKEMEGAPKNIVIVDDIVSHQVAEALAEYPKHWPIYLAGQLRENNSDGVLVPFEKGSQLVSKQVPNPIYADAAMNLGHGVVGGMMLEGSYHANQAVQLVEDYLSGTPFHTIAPITESKNQWMFDAIELQRAGISDKMLPPGSVLINSKPSFYEQYRYLVWFVAITFAMSICVIVWLNRHSRFLAAQVAKKTDALSQKAEVLDQKNQTLKDTLQTLQHTQAQLIHSEKMSSLGQLVAGIAHEINNPINFIQGNVDHIKGYINDMTSLLRLYQQEYAQPTPTIQEKQDEIDIDFLFDDVHKILASVKGGSDRIGQIVLSLRNFSRLDESIRKTVDIHTGIDSTLGILSHRLQATETHPAINVIKSYGDIPSIPCEPSQLNQVFLNIMSNAIDAIREEPSQGNRAEIHIQTHISADGQLHIEIANSGKAIPANIQDQIFDPFFTTKPVGSGTGLGLSVSYAIIQNHGGILSVQSSSEKGTTFEITLTPEKVIETSPHITAESIAAASVIAESMTTTPLSA
ncbi:MAG: ATP-binding protein [Phormidesmis sp.]